MTRQQASHAFSGILLIALGIVMLVHRSELGPVWGLWRYWPVVLIVLGLPELTFGDEKGSRSGGIWLTFIGGIFLCHTLRVLMLRDSWPLFIAAVGASILADAFQRPTPKQGV